MRIIIFLLLMSILFTSFVQADDNNKKFEKQLIRFMPKTNIFSYKPLYPASMKNENRYDTLKINSQIDKDGFVIDVQILQSTGVNLLDSIAIKTAYKYRYMPAYSEDKPITCWINENIIFDTLSQLDVGEAPPEITVFIPPEYPRLAYQAGIEGTVFLKALIDSTGKVVKVTIHKTSGINALDDAATEAIYNCKYLPAKKNGNNLEEWFMYRVNFEDGYFYFHKRNGAKRWNK